MSCKIDSHSAKQPPQIYLKITLLSLVELIELQRDSKEIKTLKTYTPIDDCPMHFVQGMNTKTDQ